MKTKENIIKKFKKNNTQNKIKYIFYKTNLFGISLIVLVITIIVIIILATAIIVTLNKNNPISEANKARYESDRDSMQAIFTNTVAKIMAKNQGSIDIKARELNEIKSGVQQTTGMASYTLENPENENNKNGTIIFDNKENTEIEYYTGRQLPIYKSGETTWYVDSEGIISLKVGKQSFGNIDNVKDEDGKLCMTEAEYQELIKKSQELITKTQELEQAKKEIEELKNKKEIPEGYLRPSGTIKITEILNNIDVSKYEFADTSELFKQSDLECQVCEQTFSNDGTPMTISLGYIPRLLFLIGTNTLGTKAHIYSYDNCNTFYISNAVEPYKITSTLKKKDGNIIFTPSTTNWRGVTVKIYAIK